MSGLSENGCYKIPDSLKESLTGFGQVADDGEVHENHRSCVRQYGYLLIPIPPSVIKYTRNT